MKPVIVLIVFSLFIFVSLSGAEEKVTPDFSSAKATITTLIKACAAGDKATLAACFSRDCEGEFKGIAEQTADDEMWQSFFEFFAGATITGAEGDVVNVKLTARDEQISLKEEGGKWRVVGF